MATALPPNTYIGGNPPLAKAWVYPDGTLSSVEPSDTQMFFIWGINKAYPKECWQWDSKGQQWLDVTANSVGQPSIGDNFDLVKEFERMVELGKKSKKCECGSESVGSSRHSTYCPKWSEDP